MKRKHAMKNKTFEVQPLNESYEDFNLFSVLSGDEELCEDSEQISAGVDIMSHQNQQVDQAELNSSEKTMKKVNPKLQKRKQKISRTKTKCKVENTLLKSDNVKQNGNLTWMRCQHCFKTHFPYPKLCRRENSMQKIKPENLDKVNECICDF